MGEGSLSQEDIDALLSGMPESAGEGGGGSAAGGDFNLADELDSLTGGGGGGSGAGGGDTPSMEDVAAALGPASTPPPPKAASKSSGQSPGSTANLNLLMDVNLALTVELGRTNKYIKDVLDLADGAVVELDKNVGEELDILANGKIVGKGKLIALDEYYGIQITEILDPHSRLG